ncbi:MAG: hypothetical protein RJA83_361 [Pseudomonadota bacterium]|jgi:hypothetical protein
MHEQDDIHQHQMIQKQLNDTLLQDVPEGLQSIVQRANEARQEVLKHGLTRMDQLIKTVDKGKLQKAEKDNSADLADLRSQSCFRKVTLGFTHLAQVSKILAEQGAEENASKRYLLEKLVKISDHKTGEGKKFLDFGSDGIYAKCSKEDKAVNSPSSTKMANTLDSVSSLANSILNAYGYPFILDKMKKLCEGIEEQKLNPEDELSSIVNALKAETFKPESPAERLYNKILLENIPFTLKTISTVAEKTMQEVLDYGVGADELAKSARTLTLELNKISKVAEIMGKHEQVEGEAGDKKFLLEKLGELSKYNLSQGSPGETLNSLMNPDKYVKLSEKDKLGDGSLAQNMSYLAQTTAHLADLVKKSYHNPSDLKMIADKLKQMPRYGIFSSSKELRDALKLTEKVKVDDKTQLESGATPAVKKSTENPSASVESVPTAINGSKSVTTRIGENKWENRLKNLPTLTNIKQQTDKVAEAAQNKNKATFFSYTKEKEKNKQKDKTQKLGGSSHR